MVKNICLSIGLCLFFFVFLEGTSSTVLVLYRMLGPNAPGRGLAGAHVRFDEELGWENVPNFSGKNYYAPGVDLMINSQGFRASQEVTEAVPPGRFRIICSGDSQTFGDGAGNDETWCQQLSSFDPRLQTVNMAEIGYGADQMYLRYKSKGAKLDHDVHLFVVCTDDLLRMRYSTMGGYGKPVLKIKNGELTAERAAIRTRSPILHWMALRPHPLRQFRSVELVADMADHFKAGREPFGPSTNKDLELQGKMIESLQALERPKNGLLVVVYIPTRTIDYTPGGASERWRLPFDAECARRGVRVIDLIDDYRKLPITTRDGLFIWPGSVHNFVESVGHFSDQGHQYIASQIYRKLALIPEVSAKLSALSAHTD